MNTTFFLSVLLVFFFILGSPTSRSNAEIGTVFSLIHDLLQNNIAGKPIVHQRTEWDFDPEVGKKRREVYVKENGPRGEIAIAKIGMGIGFEGPWGTPVKSEQTKPSG